MMAEQTGSRRSTRNHLQLNLDARDDEGEAAVEAEVVWETRKVSRGSESNGTDMTSPTTTIQAESANLKKYLMTGLQEAPGSASPQKRGKGVPLLRLSSFCKRRASDATSAGGKRPSKRSKADSTPRTRSSRRARRSNDMAKLKEIIATISHVGQPATVLPEPHSGTSSGSSGQAEAIPFPAQQVAEASEVTVVLRSDDDGDGDGDGGCDLDDDDTFAVDSAILDRMMAQYDSGTKHAAKPLATRRASSGAGKAQVPAVRAAVVTATTMLNAGKAHGRTPATTSVASAAGTAGLAVSAQPPRLVRRKSPSSAATPTASIPAKASVPSAILVQASRPNALLPIDGNAAAPPSESSGSAQSSGSKKKYTKQQIEQKKRDAMNRKRLQNEKQLGQPADADAAAAAAAATAAADASARARKQRQAETARAEQAQAQKLARTERARKNKEKAMAIRLAKMAKT